MDLLKNKAIDLITNVYSEDVFDRTQIELTDMIHTMRTKKEITKFISDYSHLRTNDTLDDIAAILDIDDATSYEEDEFDSIDKDQLVTAYDTMIASTIRENTPMYMKTFVSKLQATANANKFQNGVTLLRSLNHLRTRIMNQIEGAYDGFMSQHHNGIREYKYMKWGNATRYSIPSLLRTQLRYHYTSSNHPSMSKYMVDMVGYAYDISGIHDSRTYQNDISVEDGNDFIKEIQTYLDQTVDVNSYNPKFIQQEYAYRYMVYHNRKGNSAMKTDGLLLHHEIGSGKTRTAIKAIGECFYDFSKDVDGQNDQANVRTVFLCIPAILRYDPWIEHLLHADSNPFPDTLETEYDLPLHNIFIVHYNAYNSLTDFSNIITSNNETNTLFVIDEVHNITNPIWKNEDGGEVEGYVDKSSSDSDGSLIGFYKAVYNHPKKKIVCLTGTPIMNNVFQYISTIKLLKGKTHYEALLTQLFSYGLDSNEMEKIEIYMLSRLYQLMNDEYYFSDELNELKEALVHSTFEDRSALTRHKVFYEQSVSLLSEVTADTFGDWKEEIRDFINQYYRRHNRFFYRLKKLCSGMISYYKGSTNIKREYVFTPLSYIQQLVYKKYDAQKLDPVSILLSQHVRAGVLGRVNKTLAKQIKQSGEDLKGQKKNDNGGGPSLNEMNQSSEACNIVYSVPESKVLVQLGPKKNSIDDEHFETYDELIKSVGTNMKSSYGPNYTEYFNNPQPSTIYHSNQFALIAQRITDNASRHIVYGSEVDLPFMKAVINLLKKNEFFMNGRGEYRLLDARDDEVVDAFLDDDNKNGQNIRVLFMVDVGDVVGGDYSFKNRGIVMHVWKKMFSWGYISNYSTKIAKLMVNLVADDFEEEQSELTENQGCHIIHCRFTKIYGLEAIKQALEDTLCFKEYKSGQIDHDDGFDYHRYAVFTDKNQMIREIYNNKKNKMGKDIRVMLISDKAKEGVNFMNVQTEHMTNPWWNIPKADQIIGRGIRQGSQRHVPFWHDESRVKVIYYSSIYSTTYPYTIGDVQYGLTGKRKYKMQTNFYKMINSSNFDCDYNKHANQIECTYFNDDQLGFNGEDSDDEDSEEEEEKQEGGVDIDFYRAITYDDADSVSYILNHPETVIIPRDNEAFYTAAQNGSINSLRLLMADPRFELTDEIRERSLLEINEINSSNSPYISPELREMEEMFRNYVRPQSETERDFHDYAEDGYERGILRILNDPNTVITPSYNTALVSVGINGHHNVFRILLNDPRFDLTDEIRREIMENIGESDLEMLTLIRNYVRPPDIAMPPIPERDENVRRQLNFDDEDEEDDGVDISDLNDMPPLVDVPINDSLQTAVLDGNTEVVRFLLTNQASGYISAVDSENLEIAISQGNVDIVRMLLEDGRIITTNVLRTALDAANQMGNDVITVMIRDHLVRRSIVPDVNRNHPIYGPMTSSVSLMNAVKSENIQAVEQYISPSNINYFDGHDSLLSAAMKTNNIVIIELLKRHGAQHYVYGDQINHTTRSFVQAYDAVMNGEASTKPSVCSTGPGNIIDCGKMCREEMDTITLEKFNDMDLKTKNSLVMFYTNNNEKGDCSIVSELIKEIYIQEPLVEWVKNPNATTNEWETNTEGYGGIPKPNSPQYVKIMLRTYVNKNDLLAALRRTKHIRLTRSQTPTRLGNMAGMYGVSMTHGQQPGEYISTVSIIDQPTN
jgi:hypothetical protein